MMSLQGYLFGGNLGDETGAAVPISPECLMKGKSDVFNCLQIALPNVVRSLIAFWLLNALEMLLISPFSMSLTISAADEVTCRIISNSNI